MSTIIFLSVVHTNHENLTSSNEPLSLAEVPKTECDGDIRLMHGLNRLQHTVIRVGVFPWY